ncbi:hypothetical protein M408DRAFT_328468 [Serendipita vermifera MAFF 305830]|uniref:Chromatin modification-related protein EAF6 n=1 Tax=Serendipita vermifera MAFF 305830 TaxID=933852 RepID=A0A0C2WV65_SERVB|nr:hypothetical protein M408DRAFT_328468 [Serendipita vermifera MAFF 305830]
MAATASTSKDAPAAATNGIKQETSNNKPVVETNTTAAGSSTATPTTATANGDLSDPKTSYENVKKDLIQAIQRKKQLDKQLVAVETQIFQAEGQYIAETAGTGGNIIHGFENYLKSASTNRKRVEVSDLDRVFSQSSITYRKSLDMADDESSIEDNPNIGHVNAVTGVTTVTLTPATRAQEAQVHHKRERDKIYQRKKRASMRQSTISDEEMPMKKRRKFIDD